MRWIAILVLASVSAAACAGETIDPAPTAIQSATSTTKATAAPVDYTFPDAPEVPAGGPEPGVDAAMDRVLDAVLEGDWSTTSLQTVAASRDARLAWFVSDILRFVQGGQAEQDLVEAFTELTGVDARDDPTFRRSSWQSITNHLIAWDLPAAPGYVALKTRLFLRVEPEWAPFFADADSEIDWRLMSWGGVLIDDRPAGASGPCERGCIPALEDPLLTSAEEGDWYPDQRIVFGLVVGDDVVAFPRNIMEVHEMVNLTVGGRRIGMPYCTLCGSAQAYYTDSVPDGVRVPVLRTSGLLTRSNKVMFDLVSRSVFDTFTGEALSGSLRDAGVVLEQATVVVSTWGEWKAAHPTTRIVARDGGLGRTYPEDPLGGRDDAGPIFPIGDVDPRLPVQTPVVGVIGPDGRPVAFPADQARATLDDGVAVVVGEVELFADGGGLRARIIGGEELATHEAFWFAWSQFHPDTEVWSSLGG